jgi:mono/diheme cytochrome c family protein
MKPTRFPSLFLTSPFLLLAGLGSLAANEKGSNPDTKFPPLAPAEAIKTIEVPKGYRLECIASEPMVREPVSFAFDGNGSMYVCEWLTYMQDEYGTKQMEPTSRVVKLTDTDGDGIMDKRTVFIDDVLLPRTVLPMHDRVFVVFTQSKSVWAYFDDDKDGVSDRKELAYEREGPHGNIEHQHSGLVWNLDNTICSNDHIFSYDNGKLISRRHSNGRISQWGLARDDDGRLVASWAGRGNPACYFQLPAGYPVLTLPEHAPGYNTPFATCKVWDQTDGAHKTEEGVILERFTACCGHTVLRSHLMPEFYGRIVTCEPAGRLLRMSTVDWKDGLGVVDNSFPKSEFIRSTDPYFRPVWSETAPDGSFVFADMYRGIIQEKDYFGTGDGDARYQRVKKAGMPEVVSRGRIYRLVPEGKKPGPQPRMLDETPVQLVAHLAHASGWWRDSAQKLIVTRNDKSAVPALLEMAGGHADTNARIHAMWTLRGLGSLPKEIIIAGTKNSEPRIRRASVQLAEPLLAQGAPDIAAALAPMRKDTDPHVAIQLYLAHVAARKAVPEEVAARPSPVLDALKVHHGELARNEKALGDSAKSGKLVYESLCISCHGADGRGVKQGDILLSPSFETSHWFRDARHGILARILLKGQTGPINGVTYGAGAMLPLEETYSDQQLADVLNYIGERWHKWSKPIEASTISRVRGEIADRKTPWTHEELKGLQFVR